VSNIITVGYIVEGPTDKRFLEAIIKKTVEEIAFDCDGQIDVYDPVFLEVKKDNFISLALAAAHAAFNNGIFILCIHTDSDHHNDNVALENKIGPALKAIEACEEPLCKIVVPIIPITMSESWMLADKELFKNEIGTTLSNETLNLNRDPESIADPKGLIEEILRIAQEHLPQRRFKLTIGELYQPMGQKLKIQKLNRLTSFQKFKSNLENAFKELNYLH
jgi:hypothetical protein